MVPVPDEHAGAVIGRASLLSPTSTTTTTRPSSPSTSPTDAWSASLATSGSPTPRIADLAVTVVDAWHRRGVATALLTRLTERAVQAGIRRYAASVAADNRSVLELVRGSGGLDPSTAQASFGIVEAQITTPLRVPATSR
jgi:GNAT superfamily N-acetyltransferase